MKIAKHVLLLSFALGGASAFADGEIKETAKKVKTAVKSGVNAIKDEACPLVDGKVNCAAKKAKRKVEGKVDDAAEELKK